MDPLKETFSEECLSADESISFDSRVYAEIEKTKQKIYEIQPEPKEDLSFYVDDSGVVIMVVGETPEHILTNEFEKAQFRRGTDMKYLLRKLEDLYYAKEHGEFPQDVAKHEIADPEELPY